MAVYRRLVLIKFITFFTFGVLFAQKQHQSTFKYTSYYTLSFAKNNKYRWNNKGDERSIGFLSDLSTVQGVKIWNQLSLGIGFGLFYESTSKEIFYPGIFDLRYFSSSMNQGPYVFLQISKSLINSRVEGTNAELRSAKIGIGTIFKEFNNENCFSVDLYLQVTDLKLANSDFLDTKSLGISFSYIIN